jgi:hypothetical protein
MESLTEQAAMLAAPRLEEWTARASAPRQAGVSANSCCLQEEMARCELRSGAASSKECARVCIWYVCMHVRVGRTQLRVWDRSS